jgi:hypothetical protein
VVGGGVVHGSTGAGGHSTVFNQIIWGQKKTLKCPRKIGKRSSSSNLPNSCDSYSSWPEGVTYLSKSIDKILPEPDILVIFNEDDIMPFYLGPLHFLSLVIQCSS